MFQEMYEESLTNMRLLVNTLIFLCQTVMQYTLYYEASTAGIKFEFGSLENDFDSG